MSGGIITRGEELITADSILVNMSLNYQFKNWIENLELLILNMKEQVVYN
jgi:hypothetical protein